jgi:hypothetical protein
LLASASDKGNRKEQLCAYSLPTLLTLHFPPQTSLQWLPSYLHFPAHLAYVYVPFVNPAGLRPCSGCLPVSEAGAWSCTTAGKPGFVCVTLLLTATACYLVWCTASEAAAWSCTTAGKPGFVCVALLLTATACYLVLCTASEPAAWCCTTAGKPGFVCVTLLLTATACYLVWCASTLLPFTSLLLHWLQCMPCMVGTHTHTHH